MTGFPESFAQPGAWDRQQEGALVKVIGPELLDGRINHLGQHGTLCGVLQPQGIALIVTLDGHWVLFPRSCLHITPLAQAQAAAS